MENDEDFETIISLRIPLSLAKSIMALNWGLSRKDRTKASKIYRLAMQDGVQFRKLKEMVKNDPKQMKEIHRKLMGFLSEDGQKGVLSEMTVEQLETIISIATTFKETKINQLILD